MDPRKKSSVSRKSDGKRQPMLVIHFDSCLSIEGTIEGNEDDGIYREIVLRQHAVPFSDFLQINDSWNLAFFIRIIIKQYSTNADDSIRTGIRRKTLFLFGLLLFGKCRTHVLTRCVWWFAMLRTFRERNKKRQWLIVWAERRRKK